MHRPIGEELRFIRKEEKGSANGPWKKPKYPKLPEFKPKTILRKKKDDSKDV
jgi:hypothetical protein